MSVEKFSGYLSPAFVTHNSPACNEFCKRCLGSYNQRSPKKHHSSFQHEFDTYLKTHSHVLPTYLTAQLTVPQQAVEQLYRSCAMYLNYLRTNAAQLECNLSTYFKSKCFIEHPSHRYTPTPTPTLTHAQKHIQYLTVEHFLPKKDTLHGSRHSRPCLRPVGTQRCLSLVFLF